MTGFFIILLIVGLTSKYIASQATSKKEPCKGHKWTYKNLGTDYEYMVCIQCKLIPGTDMKEEDPS
jgi:hypothetical protein